MKTYSQMEWIPPFYTFPGTYPSFPTTTYPNTSTWFTVLHCVDISPYPKSFGHRSKSSSVGCKSSSQVDLPFVRACRKEKNGSRLQTPRGPRCAGCENTNHEVVTSNHAVEWKFLVGKEKSEALMTREERPEMGCLFEFRVSSTAGTRYDYC